MSLNTKEIKQFNEISTHAFKIFSSPSLSSSGTVDGYIVTISPGTVNGLLPTNIIDSNDSKLREFEINQNQMSYVKLKAFSDGRKINSAEIVVDGNVVLTQTPFPFGLPNEVEVLLGTVFNGQIYQIINTPISLGGKVQYVLKATGPDALPFVPYLIWG